MIKAKMKSGNVFFGLASENIRLMRAGRDLCTDCFPIGINCRVLITVVPKGRPMSMTYCPHGQQTRLSIALPDNILQSLVDTGIGQLHAKRVGAPFDIVVHVAETEQAIIDGLGYTGPVITEGAPAAAGVH